MSKEVSKKIAHKLREAFTEEEKAAYSRVTDRIAAGGVFCGAAMKEKRTDAGLSLRETARRIGLSDQTMGFWEKDTYRPIPEYAVKLAGIFGCRAEDLYTPGVSEVPEPAAEIGGGEEAFSERPEVPAEVCGADTAQDAVAAEGMVYGTDPVPGDLSPEELQKITDAAEAAEDASAAFTETGDAAVENGGCGVYTFTLPDDLEPQTLQEIRRAGEAAAAAITETANAASETSDAVFMFLEVADEDKPDYLRDIVTLLRRQRQKGIDKYGQKLEDNHALSPMERFEYMKEEMADMLYYAEHLQRMYREGGMGADDYQRRVVEQSGMNESELLIRGVLLLSGAAGNLAGSMEDILFHFDMEIDREGMADQLAQIARGLAFAAEGIGMTLSEVMGR